jgi:hypothetical protein
MTEASLSCQFSVVSLVLSFELVRLSWRLGGLASGGRGGEGHLRKESGLARARCPDADCGFGGGAWIFGVERWVRQGWVPYTVCSRARRRKRRLGGWRG